MAEEKYLPDEQTLPRIDVSDEEFAEYLNSLDELTLLEASSLKRNVDDVIRQWMLCKETLNRIDKASADDKLNKSIVSANVLSSVDVDTREKFDADYESNINRLNQIAEKLLGIIDAHKDEVDSTVFMTKQMIAILSKKIKTLSPEEPNYERELKIGNLILDTFNDRLTGSRNNINWIGEKIIHYMRTHRKEISKSLREEMKLVLNDEKTRAIKDLCRQFSEETISKATFWLIQIFNDRVDHLIIFTNYLAHLLKHGKVSGEDSYGKLVVLDLLDIYNKIYDVPDYSVDDYMEYFYNTIVHPISDYLLRSGSRKIIVLPPKSHLGLIQSLVDPPVGAVDDSIDLAKANELLEDLLNTNHTKKEETVEE